MRNFRLGCGVYLRIGLGDSRVVIFSVGLGGGILVCKKLEGIVVGLLISRLFIL